MTAITFDTQQFVETLQKGEFTETQAKALSKAVKNVQRESDLATKGDLNLGMSQLRAEMSQLRAEMREMEQRIKVDLIKWMVGLLVAQTALLVGLFNLMGGS